MAPAKSQFESHWQPRPLALPVYSTCECIRCAVACSVAPSASSTGTLGTGASIHSTQVTSPEPSPLFACLIRSSESPPRLHHPHRLISLCKRASTNDLSLQIGARCASSRIALRFKVTLSGGGRLSRLYVFSLQTRKHLGSYAGPLMIFFKTWLLQLGSLSCRPWIDMR